MATKHLPFLQQWQPVLQMYFYSGRVNRIAAKSNNNSFGKFFV